MVSIITLNYNQTRTTCEFLTSTQTLNYSNYEILVCDMASDIDPEPLITAGNFPKTRLLISKQNLGFAGGNNWGMRHAKGDFFLIINNDTEVTPNLIELLLQPFFKDATIGAVSPKIKFFYRPDIIQYAGFNAISPFTGRTSTVGEMERDRGQYNTSRTTNAAHGCAMMVRKEVIKKTGMFPEKFFLYYEEWDWSARILKAGYTIWYAADAIVFHKESMSVGRENPLKVYYHTRNRILYMRRNTDTFHFIIFSLFFALITIPTSMFNYLLGGKFRHLFFLFKGIIWNFLYSSDSKT